MRPRPSVSWGPTCRFRRFLLLLPLPSKGLVPDRNEQQKEAGDGDAAAGAGYKKNVASRISIRCGAVEKCVCTCPVRLSPDTVDVSYEQWIRF